MPVKKGLFLLIISTIFLGFSLSGGTISASAATEKMVGPIAHHAWTAPLYRVRRAHWSPRRAWWWHVSHEGAPGEINQFRSGNSDFNNPIRSIGHGISNTGNSGHNRGRNEDNDTNDGNQILTPSHLGRFRRVNQYNYGNSNYNNPVLHIGYDQINNGNSGTNDGLNQDNSSNGGNQIVG